MPLVRQPVIRWLLAAVTAIQCSHAVYYGFGTLEWRRLGIPDGAIGLLWSTGVLGEILLFWRGQSVLKRLDPLALMMLSGAAGALRWTLTPLATWLPALVVVQLLHALTFAACHLGMMMVLSRAVPFSHSATAQGLVTAMSGAIGFSVVMASAGWLYARFGAEAYWFMAVLAAAGMIAALMVKRRWNGEALKLT
jgi:PPP family 3-phenylpropionic acid transporter